MKIEFKVEFDTENQKDLDKIEQVISYLQEIKESLEARKENLNKDVKRRRSS